MLHIIEQVLDRATREQIVHTLLQNEDEWQDGKLTAGASAQAQKVNSQMSRQQPVYPALAETCLQALKQHPVFMSAALPKTIMPPLFSSYDAGQYYGSHVDNALQSNPDTNTLLRTDLSLTLFLSEPDSYDGGELIIEDAYGEHTIKLNAGDAILYPSTSLHRVNKVQSGKRLAMVTWMQSLVRSDDQRQILHDLDISHVLMRQKLQQTAAYPQVTEELDKLNQSYHNLLRLWAEC